MHHNVFGRNLSRSTNEKRRLLAMLACDVLRFGQVKTTAAKAKAVRPSVEKLITKAKKGTDAAYRQICAELMNDAVAKRLMTDARSRFSSRVSGYTRIITLPPRLGDATTQVVLALVDEPVEEKEPPKEIKKEAVREKKEKKSHPGKPVKEKK